MSIIKFDKGTIYNYVCVICGIISNHFYTGTTYIIKQFTFTMNLHYGTICIAFVQDGKRYKLLLVCGHLKFTFTLVTSSVNEKSVFISE